MDENFFFTWILLVTREALISLIFIIYLYYLESNSKCNHTLADGQVEPF